MFAGVLLVHGHHFWGSRHGATAPAHSRAWCSTPVMGAAVRAPKLGDEPYCLHRQPGSWRM